MNPQTTRNARGFWRSDRTADGPVENLTAEQIRRARLRVASSARSSRDCKDLLDALGIGAE